MLRVMNIERELDPSKVGGWDLADKKKAEEAEKEKDTDTSDDMPVKERKARAR